MSEGKHQRQDVTFRICDLSETFVIVEFLWSMRQAFHFTERETIEEVAHRLFQKGGAVGCYAGDDRNLVGLFGYFLGTPSHDYADKLIGFVYIAGIAKPYRHTGVFIRGLHFLAQVLHDQGVREIRCHAAEDNRYNNRLYARLGKPIAREPNRRGDMCILYANSVEKVLTLTTKLVKRIAKTTGETAIKS